MGFFEIFRRKTPMSDGGKQAESLQDQSTPHCFVLCPAAQPKDLSQAGAVVAEIFGRGYSAEVGKQNIVTVSHGKQTVGFLAHMAAPIPNGEAEANADGNFLWPDGKEEAAKHRSHVIV